jgi:DnaJ family protein C protein 2
VVEEPRPEQWSAEQQKQLEAGMRQHPGTMPVKERWIKIAEGVEGKSAKECYERYKEICAQLKKQQETK